jgi:hypothetical protein
VGQRGLINHQRAASDCPGVIAVQTPLESKVWWMAELGQSMLSDKRRHTYIRGKLLHGSIVEEVCHLCLVYVKTST